MENEIELQGIADGKRFSIEVLNTEAIDAIRAAKEKYSGSDGADQRALTRETLYAVLLSSNSLAAALGFAGRESTPECKATLRDIVGRLKVQDVERLVSIFVEVNRDFLEKKGLKIEATTQTLPAQSPSSQS